MWAFIDQYREALRVEPNCRVLQIPPPGIGAMPRGNGILHAGAPGRSAMRS